MTPEEAIKRAKVDPADVQHVVLGQAIPSEPRDSYIARIAAVEAGVPICINTDAHDFTDMDHLLYGVLTARRG